MVDLDAVLAPAGLVLLLGYHVHLMYRVCWFPKSTVIGVNQINRSVWVRTMMRDGLRNGILAVQTLRNNIMSASLLAAAAITLSSLIAILVSSTYGLATLSSVEQQTDFKAESPTTWVKLLCLLVCLLLVFCSEVQSVRYYSHVSFLISIPTSETTSGLTPEYVASAMVKAGQFWSIGLRLFYFSVPLFLWLLGPISMFVCCVVSVAMLHFLDTTQDLRHGCLIAPELEQNCEVEVVDGPRMNVTYNLNA